MLWGLIFPKETIKLLVNLIMSFSFQQHKLHIVTVKKENWSTLKGGNVRNVSNRVFFLDEASNKPVAETQQRPLGDTGLDSQFRKPLVSQNNNFASDHLQNEENSEVDSLLTTCIQVMLYFCFVAHTKPAFLATWFAPAAWNTCMGWKGVGATQWLNIALNQTLLNSEVVYPKPRSESQKVSFKGKQSRL